MFDPSAAGVLYTEHSHLAAMTPIASLWSYETRARGRDRRSITLNPDGSCEYWLDRSDPLLNTMLPGAHVSVIINVGDPWATGRSLAASALLPRACVLGPLTQPRLLRVGRSVQAIGAVIPPTLTRGLLGVPPSELVDRIVPLDDLWTRSAIERLFVRLTHLGVRHGLSALRDEVVTRSHPVGRPDTVGQSASRVIRARAGRISIDRLARSHGLSRQLFSRRFGVAAGLPPKLFARITRFQALVHALLSTDVSQWASMSPALGYYDQAHMINEFRAFAGSSPTVFFRPRGGGVDPATLQLRGRPSEWAPQSAGRISPIGC